MALSAYYGVARTTAGTIIISAAVEVRRAADNSLATIFADETGTTPINNGVDFVTGSDGTFLFYAEPDRYNVLVGSGASQVTVPADIVDGRAQVPWPSRAQAVTDIAGGFVAPDGTVKSDGTVFYIASAGAIAIADMPGWLPFGEERPDHHGENTTPGTTDTKTFIEAVSLSADLRPVEHSVGSRVTAPRVASLPYGASITGSDYDMGGTIVSGVFLDATDWSGGTSTYLTRPNGLQHDMTYAGDVDDHRKHSFHIFRYYDGKATAARALGGSALLPHVAVGKNSSGDPATGTNSALEANVQAYHVLNEAASTTRTELTPIAAGVNCRDVGAPQVGVNVYNDFVVHGSRSTDSADREGFLCGGSFFVAKYTPGNTLDTVDKGHDGSYGVNVWTNPGGGGFKDGQLKTGWTSYTMRAGISVGGWAGENGVANDGHSASATSAYIYGLLIGKDSASVWSAGSPNSKIQYGIKVGDFTDVGILIDDKHPDADADSVALAVRSTAGVSVFGNDADGGVSDRIEIYGTAAFTPLAVNLSTGEYWKHRITSGKDYHLGYSTGGGDVFSFQVKLSSPNNSLIVGTTNVTVRKPLFTSLPTSASGLATGEVWNDAGTLKVA